MLSRLVATPGSGFCTRVFRRQMLFKGHPKRYYTKQSKETTNIIDILSQARLNLGNPNQPIQQFTDLSSLQNVYKSPNYINSQILRYVEQKEYESAIQTFGQMVKMRVFPKDETLLLLAISIANINPFASYFYLMKILKINANVFTQLESNSNSLNGKQTTNSLPSSTFSPQNRHRIKHALADKMVTYFENHSWAPNRAFLDVKKLVEFFESRNLGFLLEEENIFDIHGLKTTNNTLQSSSFPMNKLMQTWMDKKCEVFVWHYMNFVAKSPSYFEINRSIMTCHSRGKVEEGWQLYMKWKNENPHPELLESVLAMLSHHIALYSTPSSINVILGRLDNIISQLSILCRTGKHAVEVWMYSIRFLCTQPACLKHVTSLWNIIIKNPEFSEQLTASNCVMVMNSLVKARAPLSQVEAVFCAILSLIHLPLTRSAFNCMVKAYSRIGTPEQTWRLVHLMRQLGTEPSRVCIVPKQTPISENSQNKQKKYPTVHTKEQNEDKMKQFYTKETALDEVVDPSHEDTFLYAASTIVANKLASVDTTKIAVEPVYSRTSVSADNSRKPYENESVELLSTSAPSISPQAVLQYVYSNHMHLSLSDSKKLQQIVQRYHEQLQLPNSSNKVQRNTTLPLHIDDQRNVWPDNITMSILLDMEGFKRGVPSMLRLFHSIPYQFQLPQCINNWDTILEHLLFNGNYLEFLNYFEMMLQTPGLACSWRQATLLRRLDALHPAFPLTIKSQLSIISKTLHLKVDYSRLLDSHDRDYLIKLIAVWRNHFQPNQPKPEHLSSLEIEANKLLWLNVHTELPKGAQSST